MKSNYLFPDFPDNESTYLAAQQLWQELIERIAATHADTVTSYMDLQQTGNAVRDGNPLVALRATESGHAVRILQSGAEAEGDDLSAWLNNFGAPDGEDDGSGIPELVIDVRATPLTVGLAAVLIDRWLGERLVEDDLEDLPGFFRPGPDGEG